MKTSTALILAGAGVVILLIYSRSKTSTPTSLFGAPTTATAAVTGLFSGFGSSLGKLLSGSSSPSSPSSVNTTSSVASSPIGTDSQGNFTVDNSEINNITGYDSQTGAVGVYGIDYGE